MSSAGQEMLTSLIRRLEAATQRLERYTEAHAGDGSTTTGTASALSTEEIELPPSVVAYDDFIQTAVQKYLNLSQELGGAVAEQAQVIEQLARRQRGLILKASQVRKPAPNGPEFTAWLNPLQECIMATDEVRKQHRANKELFDELSVVSDGAGAFGWVVVEPTPGPYVKDMRDGAHFYAIRVMKMFKDKDPKPIEWVNSFLAMLDSLTDYVKQHHKTGLTWNPKGVDIKDFTEAPTTTASAPPPAPAPPAGGAPPPPPPPPAAPASGSSDQQVDMSAVFQQLNKGEGITAGLRKVDKSQMTHKNPALRSGSPVKSLQAGKGKPAPPIPTKPRSLTKKQPPKMALEGNRWAVENYRSDEVTVEISDFRQSVYLFNCENTTVHVRGKANAVTMLKCKKVGLLVESVIAVADIVNSSSIKFQVTGRLPSLMIDKCDGVQVFLSPECADIAITTAKTSEINVSMQGVEEGSDYVEHPVPEQLCSVFKNGKLHTTAVDHA
ncbi:suppressor of rasval19 [Dimargaris verticillata]|uniref:Adenylyl cyclase-associated protein n=1 Tax=Dimargaris verticillata TaxID=2761393 RepID=A0A9W8EBH7_9FUNG|nr:suppressor of rasval19 [Dimargaris verticillata]